MADKIKWSDWVSLGKPDIGTARVTLFPNGDEDGRLELFWHAGGAIFKCAKQHRPAP